MISPFASLATACCFRSRGAPLPMRPGCRGAGSPGSGAVDFLRALATAFGRPVPGSLPAGVTKPRAFGHDTPAGCAGGSGGNGSGPIAAAPGAAPSSPPALSHPSAGISDPHWLQNLAARSTGEQHWWQKNCETAIESSSAAASASSFPTSSSGGGAVTAVPGADAHCALSKCVVCLASMWALEGFPFIQSLIGVMSDTSFESSSITHLFQFVSR
mmetsp:Transcript_30392/g.79731  ORF Transcript_30392/g.79731 Transcript_30392/m.79731 type:complete len:215 (-) Transcript_30392:1122-1766(-)